MTLNTDALLYVAKYMPPEQQVEVSLLNQDVRKESFSLLKNSYRRIFGEIDETHEPIQEAISRLLKCALKEPTSAFKWHIETPISFFERWKLIAGVESAFDKFDKQVQKIYNENISLLENTQATSIHQLKNQLTAFWHINHQVDDYKKTISHMKTEATKGLINKIFFACISRLLRCFYNPSNVFVEKKPSEEANENVAKNGESDLNGKNNKSTGKKLSERASETFAKIGGFDLNGKSYDVVASHIVDGTSHFKSLSYGKTTIGIFEKGNPYTGESLGHYGASHNFSVCIERMRENQKVFIKFSSEGSPDHGEDPVFDDERYLEIGNRLEYRDSTRYNPQGSPKGSDRLLDQKLTQIIIEMAKQNQRIVGVKTDSHHDDLPVLTAAGFNSNQEADVVAELETFRTESENSLFPPYRDYYGFITEYNLANYEEKNVRFSRGAPQSWSEIIKTAPILNPKAAVLPEYWVTKPNIVKRLSAKT